MKLIIERFKGKLYAYFETEQQFKKNGEKARKMCKSPKISSSNLNSECHLDSVLYKNDGYMVRKKSR
ncbi:hypothetical protein HYV49_01060 [Candidatus Pacearchaeota archaeon]|nr:hypothetical protein [Candidatus Pacearchaeota archaeon]